MISIGIQTGIITGIIITIIIEIIAMTATGIIAIITGTIIMTITAIMIITEAITGVIIGATTMIIGPITTMTVIAIVTGTKAGATITEMKTAIGGIEQRMKLRPGLVMMMLNDAGIVMKESKVNIAAKAQKIIPVPRKGSKKMCLTN
jgi:hypothetical protein